MWYWLIAWCSACLIAYFAFRVGVSVERERWVRSLVPFHREREE